MLDELEKERCLVVLVLFVQMLLLLGIPRLVLTFVSKLLAIETLSITRALELDVEDGSNCS